MKISRQWLSDYVDFDELSVEDFSELITTRVAEVDDVHTLGAVLADAIVVEVKSVKSHPTKESLTIAEVNTGNAVVNVVCGADNCAAGLKTAYIKPGTSFFAQGNADKKIIVEKRDIAGVESEGVLLSEAELDISSDHSGIVELPKEAKVGCKLQELFGLPDTVLEIDNKSLTHRPDLWSHVGFAREIAAILNKPLKIDVDQWSDDKASGQKLLKALGKGKANYKVSIAKDCGCRRFAALEISGVKVERSPLWLRRRLHNVGAGVRNTLVDISNYVLHDVGQPNHIYDAKLFNGDTFVVRRANDKEVFAGLDDKDYQLTNEDIVIADDKSAVALGGVLGGRNSSVCDSTEHIVLESANFDPVLVRKTTKRHQVRTDSSNRFEKSQSIYSVPFALHRYIELLKDICPTTNVAACVSDEIVGEQPAISVDFSYDFIRQRLGSDIGDKRINEILTSLSFEIADKKGKCVASVPHYRATRDISIAEDLVEEIGRIHGYENIPEVAPAILSKAPKTDYLRILENKLRDFLAANGFSEISTYSFTSEQQLSNFGYSSANLIELKNQVSVESTHMRPVLAPSMFECIERNYRFQKNFALFEVGRVFSKDNGKGNSPAVEGRKLCIAIVGDRKEANQSRQLMPSLESGALFYQLRYLLGDVIERCSFRIIDTASIDNSKDLLGWMHPYRAANITLDNQVVGSIAEVRPGLLDDVNDRVVLAEVDLVKLLDKCEKVSEYKPISKFPESLFEVSVVMPKNDEFAVLRGVVERSIDSELLKEFKAISVYSGKPLADDEKSVSLKLAFASDDRTLSSEEIKSLQESVVGAINKSGYSLRS